MNEGIVLTKEELDYLEYLLDRYEEYIESLQSENPEYKEDEGFQKVVTDLKFLKKKFKNRDNNFVNQLYTDYEGNLYRTKHLVEVSNQTEQLVCYYSVIDENNLLFTGKNDFLKKFSLVEIHFKDQLFKDLDGNIYVTVHLAENPEVGASMVIYQHAQNKNTILYMEKDKFLETYTFYKPGLISQ